MVTMKMIEAADWNKSRVAATFLWKKVQKRYKMRKGKTPGTGKARFYGKSGKNLSSFYINATYL